MPNPYINRVDIQRGNTTETLINIGDTTAVAADVAQGKYFYLATGEKVAGTSSGGVTVESLSVTQNGTYTAPTGKAYSPVTVSVSGGGGDLKAYIERSSSTPTLPSDLTCIGDYAFYHWDTLELSSLPSGVTTIGTSAFQSCSSLNLSSLPSGLTSIGDYAFQNCSSLSLSSLPDGIRYINLYAFRNCTSLILTTLPTGINEVKKYAFSGCKNMPLEKIPNISGQIDEYAFQGCTSITSLDCSNTYRIAANAFNGCTGLETLVLRRTSVCTLVNVSAFTNTPMRGYGNKTGTVYVPSSLIASYKTASNWKTLYNAGTVAFVAIEGSEYELS